VFASIPFFSQKNGGACGVVPEATGEPEIINNGEGKEGRVDSLRKQAIALIDPVVGETGSGG